MIMKMCKLRLAAMCLAITVIAVGAQAGNFVQKTKQYAGSHRGRSSYESAIGEIQGHDGQH